LTFIDPEYCLLYYLNSKYLNTIRLNGNLYFTLEKRKLSK